MKIKKNFVVSSFLVVLFIFSLFSSITLNLSLLFVLLLLKFKIDGAVQGIIFITIRSIINPGIGIDIGSAQFLKWIVLLTLCTFILIKAKKSSYSALKQVIFCCSLFLTYSLIVSIVIGSLPTISIFKILSFYIVFLACMVAVQETKIDLIIYMYKIFSVLIVGGLLCKPFAFSYLRNGYSFQGLTNHPNMLGIVTVIAVSLLIVVMVKYKERLYLNPIIYILAFYSCYLTNARTSMFSIIFISVVAFFISKVAKNIKIMLGIVILFILILLLSNQEFSQTVIDFIYKGQSDESGIFNSRENQLTTLITDFRNNVLFGNGFGVPVLPEKSYSFALSYPKESGNLIFAVLAEGGLIGFVLFSIFYASIFLKGKLNIKVLFPIALFLISMGEMIFFSANNVTPLLYLLVGAYLLNYNPNMYKQTY